MTEAESAFNISLVLGQISANLITGMTTPKRQKGGTFLKRTNSRQKGRKSPVIAIKGRFRPFEALK